MKSIIQSLRGMLGSESKGRVTIDGVTYEGVGNVTILNGVVTFDGVASAHRVKPGVMTIKVEGILGDLRTDLNVECENVAGNIAAGVNVACDDVGGNIAAGGNVSCDAVAGKVSAGGNVSVG